MADVEISDRIRKLVGRARQREGCRRGRVVRAGCFAGPVLSRISRLEITPVVRRGQIAVLAEQLASGDAGLLFHGLDPAEQDPLRLRPQRNGTVHLAVRFARARRAGAVDHGRFGDLEPLGDLARIGRHEVHTLRELLVQPAPEGLHPFVGRRPGFDQREVADEQHHLAASLGQAGRVLRGGQRFGAQPAGQLPTEDRVARKHRQFAGPVVAAFGPEDRIGGDGFAGAPIDHFLTRFAEDGLVAHVGHEVGEVVVIEQIGVGERRRTDAEEIVDLLTVQRDLLLEFGLLFVGEERGQRVVVRLLQKLDLAGVPTGVERVGQRTDNLRLVQLGLFEKRSRQTVADLEVDVRLHQIGEQADGRQVASLGVLGEGAPVPLVPQKRRAFRIETEGFVHAQAERYQGHGKSLRCGQTSCVEAAVGNSLGCCKRPTILDSDTPGRPPANFVPGEPQTSMHDPPCQTQQSTGPIPRRQAPSGARRRLLRSVRENHCVDEVTCGAWLPAATFFL